MSFRGFFQRVFKSKSVDLGKIGESEKRVSPRIFLDTHDRLEATVAIKLRDDEVFTAEALVTNVSLMGCGLQFKNEKATETIKTGDKLLSSLVIDGLPVPLKVRVVRQIAPDGIGVSFLPPYPRELNRLQNFLEPRFLGISLREIHSDNLQSDSKDALRWFQGVNDTNLFSWASLEPNLPVKQQLIFLDRVVEWDGEAGIKTGSVDRMGFDRMTGPGWVRSDTIEYDSAPDPKVLANARILLDMADIDLSQKVVFIQKIEKEERN